MKGAGSNGAGEKDTELCEKVQYFVKKEKKKYTRPINRRREINNNGGEREREQEMNR